MMIEVGVCVKLRGSDLTIGKYHERECLRD